MKPKLIILSDLWGRQKAHWLPHYTRLLSDKYTLTFYDCCELGGIDLSHYQEESLHRQFIEGGIERAVIKLLKLETQPLRILAFSIGGTIAWKFGLMGGRIERLSCVSSTRLRKETEKPLGNIHLYFGEDDPYRPQQEWFQQMKVPFTLLPHQSHDMYEEAGFAEWLTSNMR